MFNRIRAVVLFVRNYDQCVAFYRDTVGLQGTRIDDVSFDFQMGDADFILLKIEAASDMLGAAAADFSAQGKGIDRTLLCARLENVDEAYERLSARGVEFLRPPVDKPWGVRTTYFRDPEGHIWEIAHELGG